MGKRLNALILLVSLFLSLFSSFHTQIFSYVKAQETVEEAAFYTLIMDYELKNTGQSLATSVNLEIYLLDNKLGWADQEILGESIEVDGVAASPFIKTTEDNRTAKISVGSISAGESKKVTVRQTVKVRSVYFDVKPEDVGTTFPEEVMRYTLPIEGLWESDSDEIKEFAESIVGNEVNPYKKAKLILEKVMEYLTWEWQTEEHSALWAYYSQRGDCSDHANLLIALMRAAGIPAKAATGFGFIPLYTERASEIEGGFSLEQMGHAWAIIYLPNIGWVPVDSVWPEKIGSFAEADYRHITGASTDGENVVQDGNIVLPGIGTFTCTWYGSTLEGFFSGTIIPEVFIEPELQLVTQTAEGFTLALNMKNLGRTSATNLVAKISADQTYFEIIPSVQSVDNLPAGSQTVKNFEVRPRITVHGEYYFIPEIVFESVYGKLRAKGIPLKMLVDIEVAAGIIVTVYDYDGSPASKAGGETWVELIRHGEVSGITSYINQESKAVFTGLEPGTYYINVYHRPAESVSQFEFWGQMKDITFGEETKSIDFTRQMPIISDFSANFPINLDEPLYVSVAVTNINPRGQQIKIKLIIKHETGAWVYNKQSASRWVSAGETAVFTFNDLTLPEPGLYYGYAICDVIGLGTLTTDQDGWKLLITPVAFVDADMVQPALVPGNIFTVTFTAKNLGSALNDYGLSYITISVTEGLEILTWSGWSERDKLILPGETIFLKDGSPSVCREGVLEAYATFPSRSFHVLQVRFRVRDDVNDAQLIKYRLTLVDFAEYGNWETASLYTAPTKSFVKDQQDWPVYTVPKLCELFVEIDYMPGHRPTDSVLEYVRNYFLQRGINITFFVDDEVPLDNAVTRDEFFQIERLFNDLGDDRIVRDGLGRIPRLIFDSKWKWVLFGTRDGTSDFNGYCYIDIATCLYGNYIYIADESNDIWASSFFQWLVGVTPEEAETTVLMHELGHAIGIAVVDANRNEIYDRWGWSVMCYLNHENCNANPIRYSLEYWELRNIEFYVIENQTLIEGQT